MVFEMEQDKYEFRVEMPMNTKKDIKLLRDLLRVKTNAELLEKLLAEAKKEQLKGYGY